MKQYNINLSDCEFNQLNGKYPPGKGSALIGDRAVAITKIHFRREDTGCRFKSSPKGADLTVKFSTDRLALTLEIKGTEDAGKAWNKLKVSSEHSYRMLTEKKIPLYRVTNVFGQNPVIYVLVHGQHFELEPEPRWSVKEKSDRAKRGSSKKKPPGHGKDSKWKALTEWLRRQSGQEVTLLFSEASNILGFSLPASAKDHRAFWANQSNTTNRPQARAWQEAGFHVESCLLSGEGGWVQFKRSAK